MMPSVPVISFNFFFKFVTAANFSTHAIKHLYIKYYSRCCTKGGTDSCLCCSK